MPLDARNAILPRTAQDVLRPVRRPKSTVDAP
jgi:hypothetical protein